MGPRTGQLREYASLRGTSPETSQVGERQGHAWVGGSLTDPLFDSAYTGAERVIRETSFYISGLLLVTTIIKPKNDVLTNLDLGLPVGL